MELRFAALSHAYVIPGFEERCSSWKAWYHQDHYQRTDCYSQFDRNTAHFRGCPINPANSDTGDLASKFDYDTAGPVLCHFLSIQGFRVHMCAATRMTHVSCLQAMRRMRKLSSNKQRLVVGHN